MKKPYLWLVVAVALWRPVSAGEPMRHVLTDENTHRSVVVTPQGIYLLNEQGQAYAAMVQAVTGEPRGVFEVINPRTGHYVMIDPDQGISINGTPLVVQP